MRVFMLLSESGRTFIPVVLSDKEYDEFELFKSTHDFKLLNRYGIKGQKLESYFELEVLKRYLKLRDIRKQSGLANIKGDINGKKL